MSRLKAYSQITGDVVDVGPDDASPAQQRELGDMLATNRDSLIVFVDGLQKWETDDE